MSRKSLLTVILSAVGLIVIGILFYVLFPRATLLLSIAPEEFTVSINGKESNKKTGDSINVSPGTVTVIISEDGFEPLTKEFTLKNGEKIEILEALVPKTNEARALLETEKSQAIIQRITGDKTKNTVDALLKTYPILSILPITDKYYTITICDSEKFPDDRSKVAICVNLYNLEAKQSAIDVVSDKGFNLDDYETIFVDKSYNPGTQSGAGD